MLRKSVIFILIFVLGGAQSPAQDIFSTDRKVFDFGTIDCEGGLAEAEFHLTNVSDSPVYIVEVHSRCRCVRPEYDKSEVAPGKTTEIKAYLDPHDMYASQNFPLTVVYLDGQGQRNTLTLNIAAYVDRDSDEMAVRYPASLSGALRANTSRIEMSIENPGDVAHRQFVLYNAGDKPLRLSYKASSRSVMAEMPRTIAPGNEVKVVVSVKTRGYDDEQYSESITIYCTDGGQSCSGPVECGVIGIHGQIRQPWTIGRPPLSPFRDLD